MNYRCRKHRICESTEHALLDLRYGMLVMPAAASGSTTAVSTCNKPFALVLLIVLVRHYKRKGGRSRP